MLFKLSLALGALSVATAFPIEERQTTTTGDAPLTVSAETVAAAITCPFGIQKKAGGVVLLIPGTGSNGFESYNDGPYTKLLPTTGKGYDVCWLDTPQRGLNDAQITAEYVVRSVQQLAPQSATGNISIIGHSQGGGLNVPWAAMFWPSIRSKITNFIGLAPDFEGTINGNLLCNPVTQVCSPSVRQQTVPGSQYLAVQNSLLPGSFRTALIPTTSIYTITDEIVQPQAPPQLASSVIPGAVARSVQELCGPLHPADHFSMVVDQVGYGIARAALEAGRGPVNLANFDRRYCAVFVENPALAFPATAATLRSSVADAIAVGTGPQTPAEPPLKPYVCARGYATNCATA